MMKSVTIKILALALAALMVLPMLAACGDFIVKFIGEFQKARLPR